MTILPDSARMRAIEAAAIASGAVTGAELMERAGIGALDAILRRWPAFVTAPSRATVLCGPGNNGGDGFVIARHLARRGWTVHVWLLGRRDELPGDAAANGARWEAIGPIRPLDDGAEPWTEDAPPVLVIDALFGIGLSRPFAFPPVLSRLLAADAPGRPWLVALDVLSGLDADTGRRPVPPEREADGLRADLTVAFGYAKPGHHLADGPALSGALAVVDIGLDSRPRSMDARDGALRLVTRPGSGPGGAPWVGAKATPDRPEGGHKYDHGHALILAGGFGRTGAARLSARAALRIGAGLVTLAAPGASMLECATQLTAIMLRRCDDGDALAALLEDPRLNALCLGPGLGTDARAAGLVGAALAAGRGTVLDADALTLLSARDAPFAMLHERCVLTPHAGEFARLFPDLARRLGWEDGPDRTFSKVDAAREAAARAGCVVVFKGTDTVLAAPDGETRLHSAAYDRAAPWLATAGTGDVLAGMIAGLLARGLDPMEAAASAVWCHVEAALSFGPGLIAEDLPERLPQVLGMLAKTGAETRA